MSGLIAERKPWLLLLALLTFNLVLMSSRVRGSGTGTLLEQAALALASPVLKVASSVTGGVASAWHAYVDLRGVRRENLRLREAMQRLVAAAHQGEEEGREAVRLRTLLDLKEQVPFPAVAARVIGRAEGGRTLHLDRGWSRGLRPGHPVVTPRGVVGRIIESASGISKVQTILDPNSGVAALVQRTRVQGVVFGQGERGLKMEYVSALADVEVGDVVVTSGLDRIYPKGAIIGVVSAVGEGEGLTKFVAVRPEVEFDRLEEVLALVKPEGPKEDAP